MVRATDLLFGKIVVRNQLATEALVRECLQALAVEADTAATLGTVMVRRGLLTPVDAEKARHAAALAQAQRYLKFAQEMSLIAPEAAQRAVEELRRRSYVGGIGRVLLDMGMPRQIHDSIVARDPKTLDDTAAGGAPPPPSQAPPPSAPPPAPTPPRTSTAPQFSAPPPAFPPPPPAQPAAQPGYPPPPPRFQPPPPPSFAPPPPAHAAAPGHSSQSMASPYAMGPGAASLSQVPAGVASMALNAPPPPAFPPPSAPPVQSPGAWPPPPAHQPPSMHQAPSAHQPPPAHQPAPPPPQVAPPPQPAPAQVAPPPQAPPPQAWGQPPPPMAGPEIDFISSSTGSGLNQGLPPRAPAAPPPPPAPPPSPPPSPVAPPPRDSGEGSTLPVPPRGPTHQGTLQGAARELVAVALRDGIASKIEIDAILAASPLAAYVDANALADALVNARVLARPQTDLIHAFVTIEREAPSIEVEGFYLIAPLGFGVYGPVFQARRAGGARPGETSDLSLEVMPGSIARDPRRNDEFRRLCGYLPSAEHPALVRAVEVGQSNTLTFMARENPPGISLAERLAKKVLPEKDALDLGRAVVDALGALGLVQLAHGAVRPENIVLTHDGRWILRNIGATPAPVEWDPEVQPPCADLPRWLSPEAILGRPASIQSDMYALGCVLYAAVTGRAPYEGRTSAAIIAQHMQGRLPDPAAGGVTLSARFASMLQVLCHPDPNQRFRDAIELLEELEAIRGGGAGPALGAEPIPGVEPDPESTLLYQNAKGPKAAPSAGGGEDANDRTMVGGTEEDADLKEMRRLAAERRKQKAAEAAGLGGGDASGSLPQPGQKGADPLVGIVLSGRYRITKKVGAGGMGTVYLAEHLLLHKSVALKILHPKLLENQEAIQRFDREVKASSRFQHPGVVQIFDAGEDQSANGTKLHYMVMEFVDGEDLHKIVEREGALGIPRACKIFRQVLPAMDEAHKKGIVHRDMKTDNIMIMKGHDGSDVAKIMDFGIAKIIEGQESGNTGLHGQQQFKTRKGVVTGTPQYMSPEQASGDPNVDGRSDLYSFGIIMYEMVLGELPFKSNTAMGYLGKHIVEPPIPVKEARADIDLGPDLERIIMKCLEKPKDVRYQQAAEIVRDLEETVFPRFLGTPVPEGARRRSSGGGKKLLKVLVALVLMGGLGAGGFFGWGMFQRQRAEARAASIQAAAEAIAKGDAATANARLLEVGDESDPAVQAVRKAIQAIEDQKKRGEAQRALFEEAETLLQAGKLDEAEAKVREAARLGPDERVDRALQAIEEKRRRERSERLRAEADKLAEAGDAEGARARYEQAAELTGLDPELTRKLARARARVAAREGEALRQAGDDAGAAEKLREALRGISPDDVEAREIDERLRQLLAAMGMRLGEGGGGGRQAYFEALMGKARAYDARREFAAAQRYYKDAFIFCPESSAAELNRILPEAADRAEEQRLFEEARDTSQATRAKPKVGAYERTLAVELLEQYLVRYEGVVEETQRPKGHFVLEAKEELRLLKALAGRPGG